MSHSNDYSDEKFDLLFESLEADPDSDKPVGSLHTSGYFLHLVRSPDTQEFLAPTYDTLAQQIESAFKRLMEIRGMGEGAESNHQLRMSNFLPYPGHLGAISLFNSNLVVIIDSGVLTEHPLLKGKIEHVEDFTGEGIEDLCGHGTIQALRQIWFEPYARLIILKAFAGPDGRPTPKSLARALRYIFKYDKDLGFIFLAGGIDITQQPSAKVICELATEVVNKKRLVGGFVATTGNAGNDAKWCPAESEAVWGIAVADKDTFESGAGRRGGLTIPQKGAYVSFPEIHPLRIGEFYYQYASLFRQHNHFELAHEYAERALDYPYVADQTLGLLSMMASQTGNWEKAVQLVTERLKQRPSDAALHGELATALMSLGRNDEAAANFERAIQLKTRNAEIWHNYASFCEQRGDKQHALANFIEAAKLAPVLLIRLQAFGSRAFYDEDYDLAISVNEVLCELDPTFAAAYYNLSISHAFKGDIATATTFLKRYEQRAALLDTSLEQFDVQEITQTFLESDAVIKSTFLAYAMDEDRSYASEYALISALINEDEVARESRMAAFNDEELQLLANGALRCTKRLLLVGRSQHYGGIAEVLELLCKHIKGKDGKLTALIRETLGMVHHRLGDFAGAVANFYSAVKLWSSINLRRKEAALVARGFSEIALGEFKTVRATFQEVRSTSTDIRMTENFNVVSTSLTPRVHNGLTYLALQENDLKEARTQLEAAYHGDRDSVETQLLLVAVLLREGRIEETQNALGLLLRSAYRDNMSRHHFLRLLEDHPFYNVTLDDGHTVLDYFFNLWPEYLSGEVSLVTQTRVPIEQLFNVATGEYGAIIEGCTEVPPANPSTAMKVAVIGTGLMLDHPCLANHVADVMDFTGEGVQDLNGSTTMQALHLLNSNRMEGKNLGVRQQSFSLLGVKVLNKDGRGTIQQLIAGLLWARAAGAQMIMTHVQTNSKDWHLVGVVRRVARGPMIITTAPDEGEGKVFPGMVSDQVLIAGE